MYIHIYVEGGPLAPTCMGSALSGVRGAQPKFYKRKLFRFPIVDYFCKSRYVGFFYIFRNSVYPTDIFFPSQQDTILAMDVDNIPKIAFFVVAVLIVNTVYLNLLK